MTCVKAVAMESTLGGTKSARPHVFIFLTCFAAESVFQYVDSTSSVTTVSDSGLHASSTA